MDFIRIYDTVLTPAQVSAKGIPSAEIDAFHGTVSGTALSNHDYSDFGSVPYGGRDTAQTFTIRNSGSVKA